MKMRNPYRIGVTGHRAIDDPTRQFLSSEFRNLLTRAQQEHPEGVVAVSGLAEGADSLFAELALALHFPLEAVLAYNGFENDFSPGVARRLYEDLLAQCVIIHRLPFGERSDDAYMAAGCWVVDNSDLLVAAWNGQPAAGTGGTGDVVEYAMKRAKPILQLNTVQHIVHEIGPRKADEQLFEEYKLFVDDTARLSERRQSVTTTHITINGAIIGFITFLVKDAGLANEWLVLATLPLVIVGVQVCRHWRRFILKYKALVGLRFDVLREAEIRMSSPMRMYHREDALYPRNENGDMIPGKGLNFSDLEMSLPTLFIAMYLVLWLGLAVGTFLVKYLLPALGFHF